MLLNIYSVVDGESSVALCGTTVGCFVVFYGSVREEDLDENFELLVDLY